MARTKEEWLTHIQTQANKFQMVTTVNYMYPDGKMEHLVAYPQKREENDG